MSLAIVSVFSDGERVDPTYEVLSVEVSRELNRIPDARLVFLDRRRALSTFEISDASTFKPGAEVEIAFRYSGDENVSIFKGLVVHQTVEAGPDASTLTVELKDRALKLTHRRKSTVFRDQSDDAAISQLLEDAGLELGDIEATEPSYPELVQYRATDWDFALARADIQGLVLLVEDGVVSLRKMVSDDEAAHRLELGRSRILELQLDLSAGDQFSAVQSSAWDLQNQALSEPSEAESVASAAGNLDGAAAAEALGFAPYTLVHPVPTSPEELQAWANARMARSRGALIRGRLRIPGTSEIKPLDKVELLGVGERFDGVCQVSAVRHQFDHGGWQTELQLGLPPEWFARTDDIAEPLAGGLLPSVSGLQVGVVDGFEEDPEGEHRVRVTLPALGADAGPVWARLATPDAGAGRGYCFWPEPGDEIVLGFFNNDPRQPVVLGAMFSAANPPPEGMGAPSEDNLSKGVVTKKGTSLRFLDNDSAAFAVETAEGNRILVDDDAASIQITDQHGNSITMNESGVELKSAGDFKVEASGKVEITGQSIDLK